MWLYNIIIDNISDKIYLPSVKQEQVSEHSGAFSRKRGRYFLQEVVETKTELKEKPMLNLCSLHGQNIYSVMLPHVYVNRQMSANMSTSF